MAYIKLTDLSPYTIANNCTDMADINVGLQEMKNAFKTYTDTNGKSANPPKSFYIRFSKLVEKEKQFNIQNKS